MSNLKLALRKHANVLIAVLILISVAAPIFVLYVAYPSYLQYPNSFEITWKGRTFYLIFLWLFFLETILAWEELKTAKHRLKSVGTIALVVALMLPTLYVVAANNSAWNKGIVDLTWANGIKEFPDWMPLSTEYLVFTALFTLIVLLGYGLKGVGNFSTSIFFLGIIGFLYTIDNMFPYGRFTPFQMLVPTTANLSAGVLNLMGFTTAWGGIHEGAPYLLASNATQHWGAYIAWQCSGIDSLLIYSVTILLFLKKSAIPLRQRIVYFAVGAVVTYFINILRIVTIFTIGLGGGNVDLFHNYYGQLYSIGWIISYPLIIIGSRWLWGRMQISRNTKTELTPGFKPSASR
jgi:exosortase/archaeosortase family protein